MVSITEQMAIEANSMMISGDFKEISVSVGCSKDKKVDDKLIQQIVEDSIKKVSETENVTISKEDITIKIEILMEKCFNDTKVALINYI